MSKKARHIRKLYRHRYIDALPFATFKANNMDTQQSCRSIDISTLTFYFKYMCRLNPNLTRSEWKIMYKKNRRTARKTQKRAKEIHGLSWYPIKSLNGMQITLPKDYVIESAHMGPNELKLVLSRYERLKF